MTALAEQGIKSLVVGYIRRKLGIAAVKAQCNVIHFLAGWMGLGQELSLLMLEGEEQKKMWASERRAYRLSTKQGFSIARRGFAKLD